MLTQFLAILSTIVGCNSDQSPHVTFSDNVRSKCVEIDALLTSNYYENSVTIEDMVQKNLSGNPSSSERDGKPRGLEDFVPKSVATSITITKLIDTLSDVVTDDDLLYAKKMEGQSIHAKYILFSRYRKEHHPLFDEIISTYFSLADYDVTPTFGSSVHRISAPVLQRKHLTDEYRLVWE